jgi:hypothetical protein
MSDIKLPYPSIREAMALAIQLVVHVDKTDEGEPPRGASAGGQGLRYADRPVRHAVAVPGVKGRHDCIEGVAETPHIDATLSGSDCLQLPGDVGVQRHGDHDEITMTGDEASEKGAGSRVVLTP